MPNVRVPAAGSSLAGVCAALGEQQTRPETWEEFNNLHHLAKAAQVLSQVLVSEFVGGDLVKVCQPKAEPNLVAVCLDTGTLRGGRWIFYVRFGAPFLYPWKPCPHVLEIVYSI